MYPDREKILSDLDVERIQARRALRLATWWSVFFLITTDILGPFNAPFAFASVGFVPGALLYFFMFVAATWTGSILWHLFIKLDSDRFPVRTYSDLAERIFGSWARHACTVLQSIQLVINVGLICLSSGQSLSQVASAKLCFSVCVVIFVIVGLIIGQIRTLKDFTTLANGAVWLNLLIIFLSMGIMAHSAPNIASAKLAYGDDIASGPVRTAAFVSQPLFSKVNGIMNMVFAYGGAMIFPEFMAEMRRPMDFWKGMLAAQTLIFCAYMMFGVYVYAFQGQYTLAVSYQGISNFGFQTACNVIGMISGIIAAGLYGNIGIKVAYINIVEDWFRGPPIVSKRGRFIWGGMVLLYWGLAFVIVSAIPSVGSVAGLVAAICIMQFTYSFPPALMVGYQVIVDAMVGEEYSPETGVSGRKDTWRQWSRWRRGLFGGMWHVKLIHFIVALASFAMAGLGMWGTGKSVQAALQNGAATSFGCQAPV
ncbi:oligopeptide transporter protein [Exidia glandulosa HHB12029]|uniref:Oligopeptide transporter protein n=1 Tax=Exidia glandulosa HHB12029 TaxID=1314781 RepID=A0A165EI85_EXIGL|nr:oligopeptide transporter protein [Exidia glandulosa HHB12029]